MKFHLSLGKGSRSWPVPLASCPHVRSSSEDCNQCQSSPSLPTSLLCHAAPVLLHLTPTWSFVTCHVCICRNTSHLGSFVRNQLSYNLDLASMLRKLLNNREVSSFASFLETRGTLCFPLFFYPISSHHLLWMGSQCWVGGGLMQWAKCRRCANGDCLKSWRAQIY